MTTTQDKLNKLDFAKNDLKHFGKKGMRWGIRQRQTQKGVRQANKEYKNVKLKGKEKTNAIKLARLGTAAKVREINILGDKAYGAKNSKEANFFNKKADTKMGELLSSKDYAMSRKLTRGEKVYNTIGWGSLALAGIGIAAGAVSK